MIDHFIVGLVGVMAVICHVETSVFPVRHFLPPFFRAFGNTRTISYSQISSTPSLNYSIHYVFFCLLLNIRNSSSIPLAEFQLYLLSTFEPVLFLLPAAYRRSPCINPINRGCKSSRWSSQQTNSSARKSSSLAGRQGKI